MNIAKIDFKKYIKWLLFAQVLLAFSTVFVFIFFTGPLVIGAGKFSEVINLIETTDYRLWLIIAACLYFFMALTIFVTFFLIDISNWQLEEIRKNIYLLLKDKNIPVTVDIDESIPIHIEKPVQAPFSVDTALDFDEQVLVKAVIPVKMKLPIDTTIETSVLGIGSIKIPIKTYLPIDLSFPFEGEVHMKVNGFKIKLREMGQVELPPMQVPVRCQLKARLNLESNLQQVENILLKR
ncbi:MAG: hypothetical protein A2X86_10490 [Bdellovibrionales bacterium GWA2_49_15]|nr:MAG: hypothetical protein A2X86_10490 [Bdellovibrionales bacterium GWA2_49_15]HAZ14756.1 hypothetical protein [Bdellovibrionales bacterium]